MCDQDDNVLRSVTQKLTNPSCPFVERCVVGSVEALFAGPIGRQTVQIELVELVKRLQLFARTAGIAREVVAFCVQCVSDVPLAAVSVLPTLCLWKTDDVLDPQSIHHRSPSQGRRL
jgi:hypothetical protein